MVTQGCVVSVRQPGHCSLYPATFQQGAFGYAPIAMPVYVGCMLGLPPCSHPNCRDREWPTDSLSHNAMPLFFSQVPEANPQKWAIPQAVASLFHLPNMDWISCSWIQPFLSSWKKGVRHPLPASTRQGSTTS